MLSRILGSLALVVTAASSAVVGQQYVALPPGARVADVTPDGEIVVGGSGGDGFIWRWRVEPAPTFVPGGNFTAVSSDGSVIAGNMDPGTALSTAGIWTAAAGWHSLGSLPGASSGCGGGLSSAYDISADGTTVVGLSWMNSCDGRGFMWTAAGGMQPLQKLANGHNRCSAISGDGLVLGGFAQGTFSRTPAYWSWDGTGSVIDADLQGEVYELNGDGSLSVGTLAFGGPNYAAFVRDAVTGVATNLGSLQSGWAAAGSDLSEDGSVIVGFDYFQLARRAWVWTPASGIKSLEARLAAQSVAGVPKLLTCLATSADGTVIVGSAETGDYIAELQGTWTDLHGGLAGTAGIPKLAGSGTLVKLTPASLVLNQAKPFAKCALAVGFSVANLPFKQGVLVPQPNYIFTLPSLSGQGNITLNFMWKGGMPSGFAMYWQFLIADSAAPAGIALSNALKSLTP